MIPGMPAATELSAKDFFATRAGVCVYVTLHRQVFRVRFASVEAQGVVVQGHPDRAEEARVVARAALERLGPSLLPLFEKVARGTT